MKVTSKKLLLSMLVGLTTAQVHAANTGRNWSVGVLFGGASLNQNFGTKANWGFMVRDRFTPNFALGFTGTNTRLQSASDSDASASSNIVHANVDILYYLTDSPSSLWLGARIGVGAVSVTLQTGTSYSTSTSNSYFDYGPAVGGDYMVADWGSLGLDLSYMMTSFPAETLSSFQYLGTFKFHW